MDAAKLEMDDLGHLCVTAEGVRFAVKIILSAVGSACFFQRSAQFLNFVFVA